MATTRGNVPMPVAERHRILLEIGAALVSELSEEGLLRAISRALGPVLPFDRAALTLYDERTASRRILAVAGPAPSHVFTVGAELARQPSHGWLAFDHRKPYFRTDLEVVREHPLERALYEEGLRSLVAAPLVVRGESIGTINLGSLTRGRYTEVEADFLGEIAGQIALAVANVQAHEEIVTLKEQRGAPTGERPRRDHRFEPSASWSPGERARGGGQRLDRARHGRDRHRERARRASHPRLEPAERQAARRR